MVKNTLKYFADGAFSSRHLNLLNLHLGIVNFGQILRMSISAVFFLDMGLSLSATCFLMGALIGLRFIFRTPLIYIPHIYGSKVALILGQAILALAFCIYAFVDGPGSLLWLALVMMSAGEALYWHAVHTTFATLSEAGKFGRQLAARGMFMTIGGIMAPVLTGLIEHHGSWHLLFIMSGLSVGFSVIPLFFMPEPCPPLPMDWKKGMRISKTGMKLFGGWGASSAVMSVMWPMIIYLQFGSVTKFAAMMTTTTLLSFLISVFVARRIDLGKGRNVALYGGIVYILLIMLLGIFGRDPGSIALITCLVTLAASTFNQPNNAALYQWAKATHDPLWFHYWSEFGWDLGNLIVLWSAAFILYVQPEINMRWMMVAVIPSIGWCYYVYCRNAPKTLQEA